MEKSNILMLRGLQLYLVLWPTAWGLFYISHTINTPSTTAYLLGYASGLIPAIFIILGVLTRAREYTLPIRFSSWQLIAIAMVLVAALTGPSIAAQTPEYSYARLVMMFPLIMAGFGAALWLACMPVVEWKRLALATGLGMLLFVVVVFPMLPTYFVATGRDLGAGWERGIVPFFNIRRFTHSVIIALAAGTGLWVWSLQAALSTKTRMMQGGLFLSLCCGWTVIFWAGSRAPVLAFSAAVLLLLWLIAGHRRALLAGWLVPSLIGLSVSAFLPSPKTNIGTFSRIDHYSRVEGLSLNQFSANRLGIWSDTINLIREQPLFGYGHRQFSFIHHSDYATPHNFPLEMLFDFGIVGGIPALLLVYGGVLSLLWRAYYQRLTPRTSTGLLVVLTMTIQAFLDGVISDYYRIVLFGMFWAIAWVSLTLENRENAKRTGPP